MGLMDKVKAQAEQAVAKGQQAVAQGQAKVDEMQAKRAHDGLLRDLGAAYYAAQRSGGPTSDVDAALVAVDAHVAAEGTADGTVSE
ncbi:MAG TPA: hypothetical protein VHV76_08925 [Mycobacteriales bacterium]|jgi:hypothetical protein|nr:hypothetical protein [Mycobacteriales bacterium]